MFDDESMAAFYDPAAFGQVAVWQGQNINVLFDKNYAEQYGMASNNPVLRALESSFIGVVRGQVIFVNNTNYQVQGIKPDGRGEIMIELVKT
jgi:hypothetical protein